MESYSSNLGNGIPISSYLGKRDDKMLKLLNRYLMKLKDKNDVRKVILKDFCLNVIEDIYKDKDKVD